MKNVEEFRRLVRVRIYVERMMERFKNLKIFVGILLFFFVFYIDNIVMIFVVVLNL